MDESDERRLKWLLAATLAAIILGGTVDLVLDAPDSLLSAHVIYEMLLIAAALLTAVALWRGWWRAEHTLGETRRALEERGAERDAWRASARLALEGLGRAMDEQFRAWKLTPAERDVALLLLKGRSHKQIAFDTARSERTVRQHAVSVYHKSGLGGRAELAAFFLEDVMLPTDAREPDPR